MRNKLFLLILLICLITLCGCKTPVYKVTFNPNNGNDSFVVEVKEDEYVSLPENITNEGFMLKGWYNGDIEWNFHTKVKKNIELTAKWVEYYLVTLNTNNGQESKIFKVEKGKPFGILADPTPENRDYVFQGWFIGETEYDPKKPITEDTTIKAKWLKAPHIISQYKVTFILNNGETQKVRFFNEGALVTIDFEVVKEGYKLEGWYYKGQRWSFTTKLEMNIVLEAKWIPIE